jgi:Peptidase family C25
VWASENIFNYTDVRSLQTQSRQPLLLTMNCLNGFFHFPPLNSLSEELLKADGKGTIAAFSPSGLSLNDAAHVYHKALLQEILSGRHARLGDAVLAAQRDYADSGAFPELLSIYHLFGDPALRIR